MDLPKFKKEKTKLQQIEELEEQIARRKAEELAKVAPAPQPTQTLNAAPNPSNSMYDNIPKKTAALEVIRVLKQHKGTLQIPLPFDLKEQIILFDGKEEKYIKKLLEDIE